MAAFQTVLSDSFVQIFATLLVVFLIGGLFIHFTRRDEFAQRVSRFLPVLLTTTGVLGTFLGIFVGLLAFDVNDIDKSIPTLLGGLKLAFFTSIAGMGFAIVYRVISTLKPVSVGADAEEIGASNIYEAIRDMQGDIKDGNAQQKGAIDSLKAVISSDSDTSLVTQLQKLRTDTSDGHKGIQESIKVGFEAQIKEFKDFAVMMAENNSEALIEALEGVMRDFNEKINEQFGENFKKLNEAVGALLIWQENYKEHVEKTTEEFQRSLVGIEKAEQSLEAISDHSKAIPDTMGKLQTLMGALDAQINDMEAHLQTFAELKDKAKDAFPALERHFEELSKGFKEAVSDCMGSIESSLETQAGEQTRLVNETTENVKTCVSSLESGVSTSVEKIGSVLELQETTHKGLHRGFETMQVQAVASIEAFDTATKDVVKTVRQSVDDMSKELQTTVRTFRPQFEESMKETISQTTDAINQLYTGWDTQMQEEVKRTVGTMGSSLASLSNQFVKDYTPLTERLQKLVQVAERA